MIVSASSKHGATWEIAAAIAARLGERGHPAELVAPEEVRGASGPAVLGSAVYAGHWLKPAKQLAARWEGGPLWLFSSGPIGGKPDEEPVDVADLMPRAVDHRVFGGKLDRDKLSFPERAIVRAFHAPVGDFRDWDAIRAYADEIADRL